MKQYKFSFSVLFALLCLSTCFIGCNKKKQSGELQSSSNIFLHREFISSVPNGQVSTFEPITIFTATEVEGYEEGETLPNDIFKIEPSAKGTLTLRDKTTIDYKPEKPLKANQEYRVTINTKKLFKNSTIKEQLFFTFKTIEQNFSVIIDALQADEENENQQIIRGHINTADFIELSDIQPVLSAQQNKKNLSIEWQEKGLVKYFSFTIKGIEKFEQDSEIKLSWNGKSANIDQQGEDIITLPGKDNFKIIRAKIINDPEQFIQLNFSDELDKSQNLAGLIEIDTLNIDMTYAFDGNILNVYTNENLAGELQLKVNAGVKSTSGYKTKGYSEYFDFQGSKPEIKLINSGTILPNSNELKLNFETIALRAVDVRVIKIYQKNVMQFLQVNDLNGDAQIRRVGRPIAKKTIPLNTASAHTWQAYALNLQPLIQAEPGAIYRVELSFHKDYSLFKCDGVANTEPIKESTTIYAEEDFDSEENDYWDFDSYSDDYYGYRYYDWDEREDPCTDSYYSYNNGVNTNVFASDLGLVIKEGENNGITAITTNLISAQAESNVKLSFYNYQQQLITSTSTNANGIGIYTSKEKIYFVAAEKGTQKAYLSLKDGNSLTMSQFAIDGYESQKGLKGYIYGERGIWRPGDDMYLNFILNDADNPLPDNHPVKFELKDPEGVIVDQQVLQNGVNGFYRFTTKTDDMAKTGNYSAKVLVGGAAFYQSFPVETIKPNRLKINFTTSEDKKSGDIEVKWLHGAVAKNLKSTVDATIRATDTKFEKFPNYEFDDPVKQYESNEIRVFDGEINSDGKATFDVDIADENTPPGKLRIAYLTKVFENGGSFSIDSYADEYSPFESYVGILTPEADNYYRQYETDKDYNIQVATVSSTGNPIAVKDVEVEVFKVNWNWWWNTSNENLSSYVANESKNLVYSTKVTTGANGKGDFKLRINYPEWGRYLVRIKNPESGHYTGKTVYIDWPSWRGRSAKKGADAATILSFTTDKEKYKVGEDITVNFPSSNQGRALVSIEDGSKVVDAFWVEPKSDYTSFTIRSTEEMTPNVYINITYIQPHANTKNDLPIRLYGLVPIEVYNPKTTLNPTIKIAKELKPKQSYKVEVREENGKPMTYTLAVVDEGLLDLTRFSTPNAWDQFYQKQALGVRSWDIYNDVIGAYGGRLDQVFSIGGGNAAEAAGAKKAQRFKPVVDFLGPFTLPANGKQSHELTMPYYVGSVRVMVVAGDKSNQAYGSTEQAVPVKKPLMILGTLPRKISQTESVKLPVSVFAMENKIKNVSIEVVTNEFIKLKGGNKQSLSFAEPGEQEAEFELQAAEGVGIAKVDIIAKGGGETAKYTVELDVTNPNEIATVVKDIELNKNETTTLNFETIGVPGSNTASIELSTIPNIDLNKRLKYLIRYPHGCVEQVTSAVFPQLYLADVVDISNVQQQKIRSNAIAGLSRLKNYQSSTGGFHYWPGNSGVDDYASSYVGHFLLEAKSKGYDIPFGMLSNWLQYQTKESNRTTSLSKSYSQFNQAYRLYTLALAGQPNLSAMNRLRETSKLDNNAKWRLAAAYALAGQENAAEKLMRNASSDFTSEYYYYSYGSALRNKSLALETSLLLKNSANVKTFSTEIAKALNEDRYHSTQTTAMSLYSLSKMIEVNGGAGFEVQITKNQNNITINSGKPIALRDIEVLTGSNQLQLKNNKDNLVYVRLLQSGLPAIGDELPMSKNLSVSTSYVGLDGKPISIENLPQSTDFVANITIKNTSSADIRHVALTQIIPSGWEIVNTRFTEVGDDQPSKANYIDIRDDRVHYYFDLNDAKQKGNSKTFKLLLNASYAGRFYLPAANAEAMYDNDYKARTKGQWIEVVE